MNSKQKAVVYSQPNCPACIQAKKQLEIAGYVVEERMLDGVTWTKRHLLEDIPDARTVPQIIIGDTFKGSIVGLTSFLRHTE